MIRGSEEIYWLLQRLWEIPEIYGRHVAELIGNNPDEREKRETVWTEFSI